MRIIVIATKFSNIIMSFDCNQQCLSVMNINKLKEYS